MRPLAQFMTGGVNSRGSAAIHSRPTQDDEEGGQAARDKYESTYGVIGDPIDHI